MNPETRYTNRIRKHLAAEFPSIKVYKHSDRFNGGIADLHLVKSPGIVIWIEVKYMAACVHHRKVGITDLQVEFLREHAARGVAAYVLAGVGKKTVWYHIDEFDGNVYGKDLKPDAHVDNLIYDAEGGFRLCPTTV